MYFTSLSDRSGCLVDGAVAAVLINFNFLAAGSLPLFIIPSCELDFFLKTSKRSRLERHLKEAAASSLPRTECDSTFSSENWIA